MDRPIVLLTDFGMRDHYVGVMKAVMAGIAPTAQVIDLSHDVPAQSILAAQHLLAASASYLPGEAVVLVVVDPGVGTPRRPMAVNAGTRSYVAPDNGVLTPILNGEWQAVELANPRYRLPAVSHTFHGRDIFAPAAAHLSHGLPLSELGPALFDPVRQEPPRPEIRPDGTIQGQIVYIDHFGNLISNIGCAPHGVAHFNGRDLPVKTTYGMGVAGSALALVDSSGHLEIAVRDGSAAAELGGSLGQPIGWDPGR